MTTRRRRQSSAATLSGVKDSAESNSFGDVDDTNTKPSKPPKWKIWWTAARPHTLTASVSPNIVAYAAGGTYLPLNDAHVGEVVISYSWLVVLWTTFCIFMQLGCNLHNDYADFVKGADNDLRVGQARATAKGWLSPTTTARAAGTTLLCGFVVGMKLVSLLVSSGTSPSSWTVVLMVGIIISSIFSAFAYTGGPWPLGYIGLSGFSLGYSGLGDLFVFLYFGIVATTTPVFFYLACITRSNGLESTLDVSYNWKIMVQMMSHSLQVAVLAVNIIIVNNLRDRQTDVSANKRTLAVRLGATFCRMEYGFMIGVAFGLVLFDFFANGSHATSYWKLLPLLSFPLACKEWKAICVKDGSGLNPHVGGAAKVQFLFCILLAISLRKSEWLPSTND